MRDLPPQQQTEAAAPLLRKLTEATSHILLPQQLERLNQIILQTQGIRAVLMPSVADRLNLTVAQQSGISQIVETLDRKLRQRNRAGSLTRNSPAATGLRLDAELQISGLLRPSQNRLLRRLMGPPFDLKTVPQVACRAPEIRGIEEWINSEPKTLAGMRGKVVALHFYAAGCINCIRNLPHYNKWYETFAGDRFAVIGIHTPETQREHVVENVRSKAEQAEMQYPVAVDNKKETWNAWGNHVWPAVYLIDKRGFVRYWWYGELNWQQTEGEKWMRRRIEELLTEDIETQDTNNRRL
jgi:peroxiredoxin